MKRQNQNTEPWPPRLSMDEYASFIAASLADCDIRRVYRQKELEERIRVSFCIPQKGRATKD